MRDNVHASIDELSQTQLERINKGVIKEAIGRLKPNKKDSVFNVSSDFYLNAPPELLGI